MADQLAREPIAGLRVLLVSTGSEEGFMEGMRAFAARHFGGLAPEHTHVVCLDTVGSPELTLVEGEGMLVMRDYDPAFKDLIDELRARRGRASCGAGCASPSPPTG